MNSSNSQPPEHREIPRQHEGEADRLLRGIQAWCATADDVCDSEGTNGQRRLTNSVLEDAPREAGEARQVGEVRQASQERTQ